MKQISKKTPRERKLSQTELRVDVFVVAIILSLLIHFALIEGLPLLQEKPPERNKDDYVNFTFKDKPSPELPSAPKELPILETPMAETTPPKDASFLGEKNHQTEKETKAKFIPQEKNLDPGRAGKKSEKKGSKAPGASLAMESAPPPTAQERYGKKVLRPQHQAPRNAYEKLLSDSANALAGEIDAGYQDYIDGQIAEGDVVDINTTEYRFIGYFTNMRKAIELAWVYPQAAVQRGIYGKVNLRFIILANGTVRDVTVIHSSGHEILDQAIVNAIKLAAPFAPLPKGFNKKVLPVQGTFSYVLSNYYASGQ